MEEEKQTFEDDSERRGSSWRVEDLLDVESGDLAANLASTNLGEGQVVCPGTLAWGIPSSDETVDLDFNTYDMSAVLDNLDDLLMLPSSPQITTPSKLGEYGSRGSTVSMTDLSGSGGRDLEAILKAPTAHGIRNDQDNVTYLNRGQSYEIQLMSCSSSTPLYQSTLTLSFCELRWQNSEKEHFEQWCREHPCDRLLEIDSKGSSGLQSIDTDDTAVISVSFAWGCGQNAVLALKLNCLSTEFAVKKHGGEKGVPLKLLLEMHECKDEMLGNRLLVFRGMCSVKVFKDKGGDRKQRQDQVKMEKLTPAERNKYRNAESVSRFHPLSVDYSDSHTPTTPSSTSFQSTSDIMCKSSSQTPGSSPYAQTTPIHNTVGSEDTAAAATAMVGVAGCQTVDETHQWLVENRFGQYCSLFANYTSLDLLRLSRRDLIQLCGHADGIRLFNSLRTTTLKTIYVLLPGEKVYQAVYLDKLTAASLLQQLVLKLGWLSIDLVGSFVQLVPNLNVLVKVEDTLVQTIQDEDVFSVHTVKQEDGYYQVVIQYHSPASTEPAVPRLNLSLEGATQRREDLRT